MASSESFFEFSSSARNELFKMTCDFCSNAKFQIGLFSVGFIAGLSALIVFPMSMGMYLPAIFGGISSIYSGILVLDIWKRHNKRDPNRLIMPLEDTPHHFYAQYFFALVGVVCGFGLMIAFIIRGIVNHEGTSGESYMASVQCWMTFKWSLSYFMHMLKYHTVGSHQRVNQSEV